MGRGACGEGGERGGRRCRELAGEKGAEACTRGCVWPRESRSLAEVPGALLGGSVLPAPPRPLARCLRKFYRGGEDKDLSVLASESDMGLVFVTLPFRGDGDVPVESRRSGGQERPSLQLLPLSNGAAALGSGQGRSCGLFGCSSVCLQGHKATPVHVNTID